MWWTPIGGFHARTKGRPPGRLLCQIALFAFAAIWVQPADVRSQGIATGDGAPVRRIQVTRFKSRTFTLHTPFSSAVVGAPEIADVLPISDHVLYLQGKKAGTTNVSVFGPDKKLMGVYDVVVTPDTQAIAERIRSDTGSGTIRVSSSQEQIVLGGEAPNSVAAEHALEIAKSVSPDTPVINLIRVAPSQQVLLKVRFLEVSRSAERNLGVNIYSANAAGTNGINTGRSTTSIQTAPGLPLLSTIAPGTSVASLAPLVTAIGQIGKVDALISALEEKGLVRELAEPDLVALSGDTASFLAGGEVPIPVAQPSGNTMIITVEYKPFGVQLTFQPTVLATGIINLRLTPSVSELDWANAVDISGFKVPALKKREARTTIELRDGQSFSIAGLLQSKGMRDISQVPWLGTVPVLGALFRSSEYQQNETDLVVIVTPHLVAPIVPGQRTASPLDYHLPSNDVDFFLLGQTEVPKNYTEFVTSGGGLAGPYGHIVPLSNDPH